MSTHYLKSSILSTAATIALALGAATPLWAQVAAERAADASNGASQISQTLTADLRVAMMDMDEMGKMKKMDNMPKKAGMKDKPMTGMSADASMPDPDSSATMQDPMAAPPRADMMGRMRGSMNSRGMSNMAPVASLPGFPGASHLYHVGATGFFLDHPQHIILSNGQQTALNRIKQKSALDQSSSERRLEDAEQELWSLTAVDSPDAAKIEAKIRSIESSRGDQRLAFIRAVGEAGKVLTVDQQTTLLGTNPMAASNAPFAASKTAPMPTMPSASKVAPMPAMPAPMKME